MAGRDATGGGRALGARPRDASRPATAAAAREALGLQRTGRSSPASAGCSRSTTRSCCSTPSPASAPSAPTRGCCSSIRWSRHRRLRARGDRAARISATPSPSSGNVPAERLPDVYRAADVVVSIPSSDSSPRSSGRRSPAAVRSSSRTFPGRGTSWRRRAGAARRRSTPTPLAAAICPRARRRRRSPDGCGEAGRALAVAELDPAACTARVDCALPRRWSEAGVSEPRRHLGAGAALSVVVQGGPLAAAAVLSIVLARTIGPSGNGRFALLVTLSGLTAMVVSLGLSAGITYEVSRGRWSVREAFRTSYVAGARARASSGSSAGWCVFLLLHDSVFHGHLDRARRRGAREPSADARVPVRRLDPARARALRGLRGPGALALGHAAGRRRRAGDRLRTERRGGRSPRGGAGRRGRRRRYCSSPRRDGTRSSTTASRSSRALRFGLQSWGANLLQQINYRFDVLILGGVRERQRRRRLLGRAHPDERRVGAPAGAADGGLPARGEPGRSGGQRRGHDRGVGRRARQGRSPRSPAHAPDRAHHQPAAARSPCRCSTGPSSTTRSGSASSCCPGRSCWASARSSARASPAAGTRATRSTVAALSAPLALALYFGLIPPFDAWGAAVGSSLTYAFGALLGLVLLPAGHAYRLARGVLIPRPEDVADYGGLFRLWRRAWRPGQ